MDNLMMHIFNDIQIQSDVFVLKRLHSKTMLLKMSGLFPTSQ